VGRIAARHPALRLVIDHLGLHSNVRDDGCAPDIAALVALARHPNVSVKASAVPCYSNQAYPFANMTGYLEAVYQAFGPQRMAWGSDVTRLPCSYGESVRHFTQALGFLRGDDLDWVMGRALSELLRWR
jgi:predicted TIM-barrel fold metal-dependent hydrolase